VQASADSQPILRFGDFELDPHSGELRKRGIRIRFQNQLFELLTLLVERPGELVTREEIRDRLWPREEFGDLDHRLNIAINKIRQALHDSADVPRFVETVPLRGYRFIAPIERVGQAAWRKQPTLPLRIKVGLAASLFAILAGYLVVQSFQGTAGLLPAIRPATAVSGEVITSVAVLPFENLSDDPELEYLSDGTPQSIIYGLSRLPQVKVISFSSVLAYKGQTLDAQKVAKDLGVRALLIGRLNQQGDNLLVNVELVDTKDNSVLWGEQFNQKIAELLDVQEKIAMEISDNLRWQLSGEEQSMMTKRYTEDTEAYRSYLEGRYWWNKRSKEGFERAVELFNDAIEKDPLYAQAYAGLADTYTLLAAYYHRAPDDAFPQAEAAAQRALEIENNLAEAHTSLGFIRMMYDWDWAGAEAEFKRAIELNPNYATAHHWYGLFLSTQRRLEEGLEGAVRAQTLDPLSPEINRAVGDVLRYRGQYDEALEQSLRALELNPNLPGANETLTLTYWEAGMYEEAIARSEKWASVDPRRASVAPIVLRSVASGDRTEAIAALTGSEQLSAYSKAEFYSIAGESDSALEWMAQAINERDAMAPWFNVTPQFNSLRDDPRFQDLLRRMNLGP
jgi:TolB-like protein/DNA-binding winged helix-turn-helix (wHTH) protein/Tfp pilus assembly protein PilF